jgi:hypothetical protein
MANHPDYGEPRRSIRIPDDLWQAALATAAERRDAGNRDETVPLVIRRALERYVARHRKEAS